MATPSTYPPTYPSIQTPIRTTLSRCALTHVNAIGGLRRELQGLENDFKHTTVKRKIFQFDTIFRSFSQQKEVNFNLIIDIPLKMDKHKRSNYINIIYLEFMKRAKRLLHNIRWVGRCGRLGGWEDMVDFFWEGWESCGIIIFFKEIPQKINGPKENRPKAS